jgi:hypothetical protein
VVTKSYLEVAKVYVFSPWDVRFFSMGKRCQCCIILCREAGLLRMSAYCHMATYVKESVLHPSVSESLRLGGALK